MEWCRLGPGAGLRARLRSGGGTEGTRCGQPCWCGAATPFSVLYIYSHFIQITLGCNISPPLPARKGVSVVLFFDIDFDFEGS